MKKYLLTSAAALAFCGLFTSCTHDLGYDGEAAAAQNSVVKTYEQAFITAFGQPDPNQEWGFGTSTVAATRGGTRADMFGFTVPDNPTFKSKKNITKPDVITKPTISKGNATVIAENQTVSLDYNINNNIYLESGAKLLLPQGASFQNINVYMSSGSTLEAQGDVNIGGNTNFVNDGGTIIIGSEQDKKGLSTNNFGGIFWNNGLLTISNGLATSNDGGTFFNGSQGNFSATFISLNKDVELWNEGTITLSGDFTTTACDNVGHRIYNSGNISATNISLNKTVTLWTEGGTITAREKFTCINDKINIYIGIGSTISIGEDLDLYNNYQLIVNEGTLNISGDIFERNNQPEIVNYGTLTGASLELLAGAKFHNTGTATISGMTHIANSQTKWKNEGTFITEDFNITDYAVMVWNCCKMIVHKSDNTGEFKILGSFVLDRGASVVTDKVHWVNTSDIYMNGLSLFKVLGDFITDNYDCNYGMHACDDDWAVVQAGAIKQYDNANNQFRMSYYGNLWVDTDSHFELWYKDNPSNTNQPNYKFYGNAKLGHEGDEGCPTIPVANTGNRDYSCTPGYNNPPTPPTPPTPSSGKLRIICEDLSAKASDNENSDWDFNDVVFDIQLVDNDTKAEITLLAAGGTLPLCIGDRNHEVHELFAEANPSENITTSTMINTRSSGEKYTIRDCNEKTFQLDIQDDWKNGADLSDEDGLLKAVAKNMPVQVYKMVNGTKTWVTMECKKGDPAAKIAVGTDYIWCDERTDIRNQFKPTNHGNEYSAFKLYVKSILGDGWYNVREISDQQAERALR